MIDQKTKEELWQACIFFHGHSCPGLAVGFAAAIYGAELMGIDLRPEGRSQIADEEIVIIAENDACGVDALQRILSTTVGKGNLLFHITGNSAYSFYKRKTGESFRLVLKPYDRDMNRSEKVEYLLTTPVRDLFEVKETTIPIPSKAKVFHSYICETCHEKTGEHWMRIQDGKKVCLDCFEKYRTLEI